MGYLFFTPLGTPSLYHAFYFSPSLHCPFASRDPLSLFLLSPSFLPSFSSFLTIVPRCLLNISSGVFPFSKNLKRVWVRDWGETASSNGVFKRRFQTALSNGVVKRRRQTASSNGVVKRRCQTALSNGVVKWRCQRASLNSIVKRR